MVHSLTPQMTHQVTVSFTTGGYYEPSNIIEATMEDVDDLLTADTEKKLRKVWLSLFQPFGNIEEDAIASDIDFARRLLILALHAQYYAQNPNPSREMLESCDVSVFDCNKTKSKDFTGLQEQLRENMTKACGDLNKALSSSWFSDRSKKTVLLEGNIFSANFSTAANLSSIPAYSQFLSCACKSQKWWTFDINKELDLFYLDYNLGYYELTPSGLSECLQTLSDALFSLHLSAIHTICANGKEMRISDSAISSLWWVALDGMREGRLGICESCSRPFIAKKERGTLRKYCSDACRQWGSNHPNEPKPDKTKYAILNNLQSL